MAHHSHAQNCFNGNERKTVPPDQIDRLSYGLHPDGHVNPYETPSTVTEYQLKFCTEKLETSDQPELSRTERERVLGMMDKLSTVQRRSYTNPYDSHYPVIGSTSMRPMPDKIREAEMKHYKMNGWSEYQANYDRYNFGAIYTSNLV